MVSKISKLYIGNEVSSMTLKISFKTCKFDKETSASYMYFL